MIILLSKRVLPFVKMFSLFFSTSGFCRSDTITHVVHMSRVMKQRNRFNFSFKTVTRVKFSLTHDLALSGFRTSVFTKPEILLS
jgi:hypothetical protein